jgi:hypothetical protein
MTAVAALWVALLAACGLAQLLWVRLGQARDELATAGHERDVSEGMRTLRREQSDHLTDRLLACDRECEHLHERMARISTAWIDAELYGVEADAQIDALETHVIRLVGDIARLAELVGGLPASDGGGER